MSSAASFLSCYTCGLEETILECHSRTSTSFTVNTDPSTEDSDKNSIQNSSEDGENNNPKANKGNKHKKTYHQSHQTTNSIMRRASTSRREHPMLGSPLPRPRSSERLSTANEHDDFVGDDNNSLIGGAGLYIDDNDRLAESTDNDSSAPEVEDDDYQQPPHESKSQRLSRRMHERAMSDPFDTQEVHSVIQQVQREDNLRLEPKPLAYPTLLRYPVAETRNKNCWSEPPVTIFSVRGPQYFGNKKKVTSGPYLLGARGADLFLFESNKNPVRLQDRSHLILGGHLRTVPTLLVNFQFPWGVMVLYFEIPAKLAAYVQPSTPLMSNLTSSERTLAKWLQGDDDYKNDRLKLIPYVAEGPWVVRNMVTGRPAIIGRKLPVIHRTLPQQGAAAPLVEVTLDIGSSSATAKRIVSVCRRYMSGLTADIGLVIQAETPNELPEQMMGSIRVHGPDPLKSPKI